MGFQRLIFIMQSNQALPKNILSVSEINRQTRLFLESNFDAIQVKGEISNLARPASQHLYFSLKDDSAQIKCAFFKGQQREWNRKLENGQSVILCGKLTVYEARGDYQLIVSDVIADGEGLLLQQIEQLKQKLKSEGLFAQELKQSIPAMPMNIGVITSHSGAALHDILSTLQKRFPIAKVTVYACEVQGISAATSIKKVLAYAIQSAKDDVLLIARGGGSVEDLMPFNDESLARAIHACPIPIISGVGHETDFTICDFVADFRAPTPTGAAQACCADIFQLRQHIQYMQNTLTKILSQVVTAHLKQIEWLRKQLLTPSQLMFTNRWQHLDYLQIRLNQTMKNLIHNQANVTNQAFNQLYKYHPKSVILNYQHQFNFMGHRLQQAIQQYLNLKKQPLKNVLTSLHALSPLATLSRGYAIATTNNIIITDPRQVQVGENIDIRVKYGHILCQVIERESKNEK